MDQLQMFGDAKWIGARKDRSTESILIRRSFTASDKTSGTLRLIGLGTFEVYINGMRVSDDRFLPLSSEYENINIPAGEELSYRIYATEYDVSSYLHEGENCLAVLLGFGWYTGITLWGRKQKVYGNKKLIYALTLSDEDGKTETVLSNGKEKYIDAFVVGGHMHKGEEQDYRKWSAKYLSAELDVSDWQSVEFEVPVKSEYLFTDCPADTVAQYLEPTVIYRTDSYCIYDAGRNISGYPILSRKDKEYSRVHVNFSECLDASGRELDEAHMHNQSFDAIASCDSGELYPHFTWYAFRYFKVEGDAEVQSVAVVHTNLKVDSDFKCSDETLNWIYKTFVNTQLANMHRGIPSDCPHIERLGYTGDGQLVCKSVLHTLGAESFYRKWIGDISDCRDRGTGHVQNTAPYIAAGGGPGGWGSAIVAVPYEFWRYYGDRSVIEDNLDGMLRYLDFLEEHCEAGLVTSDIKSASWCLGDWCTPPDQSNLPAPFVNTYFYVRSIQRVLEIADALGRIDDVDYLKDRLKRSKAAIDKFYLNPMERDMTYLGNVKGASAFALDMGLGNELTAKKLAAYYERLGHYDTGIFGTELVTRCLFKLGRADIAYTLLTASEPHGFGKWRANGESTLPEYWNTARSHNHPMFGAVVACFFEYILGIRQQEGSTGYDRVIISPAHIASLSSVSGYITTPHGRISVAYSISDSIREYEIYIPNGTVARVDIDGKELITVTEGKYTFKL